MTSTNITIEQLAEKLNGKLWVKGDLKRIYLDRGYNTKKMSTKSYIFEKDGEFIAVCNIECPSQDWNWIKSQQQEVVEGINEDVQQAIEELTSENVYVISKDGEFVDYFLNKFEAGNELYSSDVYYSEARAAKVIEENDLKGVEIKSFSKEEWSAMCAKYIPKEVEEAPIERQEVMPAMPIEKKEVVSYPIGAKVQHSRFGIGEVVSDNEKEIEITFPEIGFKKLLKAFVTLTIVE